MENNIKKANKVSLHYVAKDVNGQNYVVYLRQICQKNGKDSIKGIFPYEKGTTVQAAKNASNFCARLNKELPTKVSPNFAVHSHLDVLTLLNEYVSHLVYGKLYFTIKHGFNSLNNSPLETPFAEIEFLQNELYGCANSIKSALFSENKVTAYVKRFRLENHESIAEIVPISCHNLADLIALTK